MINLSRTENGILGEWWWVVDRPLMLAFFIMIIFGSLMAMSATPMVSNRIGIDEFYFLKRHLLYIIPSLITIFFVSLFDNDELKKFSLTLYFMAMILMILTLFFGSEIKGARRWISICGLSLQPSEFVKPTLMIITAWMLSEQRKFPEFKGTTLAFLFFAFFISILVLQPDVGMCVISAVTWFGLLFLNGFPIILIVAVIVSGIGSFVMAYFFLPHVTTRVDRFLNPNIGDHYQINRSLEAFSQGGLFGVGPGEGIIKKHIPDVHADFVFAVIGEEFGFFICVFLVLVIAFIVIYGMIKSMKENDLFTMLASVGLLSQFGLQSIINIASTLHLMPTKGMTLPFISYGGSSMFAISILVGMILALNKKKSVIKAAELET